MALVRAKSGDYFGFKSPCKVKNINAALIEGLSQGFKVKNNKKWGFISIL